MHLVEYAALRTMAAIVRALPLETGSALFGRLWRVFAPLNARHRRVLANLEIALPDLDEASRRAIAAAQWDNLGRVFAETFHLDRIARDPGRVVVTLSPGLEARLAAHAGGIAFVAPHTANWEVAGIAAQRLRKVAGLYQSLSNPRSERYLASIRMNAFPNGVFSKGHGTPAAMMRWIRAGNGVAMLGDSYERRGVDARFFGHPTRVNPFPAMLARRLGVPLVAATMERLPGCRFHVKAVGIPVPRTDDVTADVAAATQAVLDHFEQAIRQRPGEWMWVLNVWRKTLKRRSVVSPRPSP